MHVGYLLHNFYVFTYIPQCSDIRGVAVDGVVGEPLNLTEPVTQAIAAAFAAWLSDKKKADSSKRLKISIGHDSRISAQKLQVSNSAISMNDLSVGFDGLHNFCWLCCFAGCGFSRNCRCGF